MQNNKLLSKKKKDKKTMTWFSITTGILALAVLIVSIVLKVSNNELANGILALSVVFLVFCVMGIVIVFILKKAIKEIEHPEIKKDEKLNTSYPQRKNGSLNYRVNPYTDELEVDDGLSIEEIDHLESDIFDDI